MSKRLAILSICTVLAMEMLFPPGTIADVVRLPEIFAHFERHRQESPDMTFLQFLGLHYGDSDHLSTPEPGHEKLPFSKRIHRQIVSLQSVPGEGNLLAPKAPEVLMIIGEVVYQPGSVPSFSSSIWQPPKI